MDKQTKKDKVSAWGHTVSEGKSWYCKLRVHDSKLTLYTAKLGGPSKNTCPGPANTCSELWDLGCVKCALWFSGDRASGKEWNSMT